MISLRDGVLRKEDVDVQKYICWKDNVMLLDNDSVGGVLDKLARYYGISIAYDKDIADRKLSGKLDLCETVDDVLDIVRESATLRIDKTVVGEYHFMKE